MYPDKIQSDSNCLLYDRFVAEAKDPFSLFMMDQYLDLGAQARQTATLSHFQAIKLCEES